MAKFILRLKLISCLLAFFAVTNAFAGENNVFLNGQFKTDLGTYSQFTIAVMPMQNMSVDSEVAYHFRQRVAERLIASGYNLADMSKIDNKLYEIGVQNSDQIQLLSFQKVTELVKADAYIFGIIEQAKQQHAIAYNSYVYTSSIKMQDKRGKLLWSALQERVVKRRFALDPINALLDIFLVKGGGNKEDAVYALADKLLQSLPNGPVTVTVSDPLFEQAEEINVKVVEKNDKGTSIDE